MKPYCFVYFIEGQEEKLHKLFANDIILLLSRVCGTITSQFVNFANESYLTAIGPDTVKTCLEQVIKQTILETYLKGNVTDVRLSGMATLPDFEAFARSQEDIFVFKGPIHPSQLSQFWIFVNRGGIYEYVDTSDTESEYDYILYKESTGEIKVKVDTLTNDYVTISPGDILWPFPLLATEQLTPFIQMRHAFRIEDGSELKGLICSREGTVKHTALRLLAKLEACSRECETAFLGELDLGQDED